MADAAVTGGARGWTPLAVGPITVLVLLLLSAAPPFQGVGGDGAPDPLGDPSVGVVDFHQVLSMQGDDPSTEEVEHKGRVALIHRAFWKIPGGSSEVYTWIPPGATDVHLDNVRPVSHQGSTIYVPGPLSAAENPDDPPATGVVTEGAYSGYHYWRFPTHADRDLVHELVFSTDEDWADLDPNLTVAGEWNVSGGGLSLASNTPGAVWTSKMYEGGLDIVSVNVSRTGTGTGNMTFEVSGDDGTNWVPVEPDMETPVPGTDGRFRWRVAMVQNTTLNATPILTAATFSITFTPATTDVWIQASYTMAMEEGELEFDLRFTFDEPGAGLVFLGYVDHDVRMDVTGTNVTYKADTEYPKKALYFRMVGAYSSTVRMHIHRLEDDGSAAGYPWIAVAIPIVLILIMVLAHLVVGGKREATEGDGGDEPAGEGEEADDEDVGPGEPGGEGEDPETLGERRSELLDAIRRLDEEHERGLLDDDEHRRRRADLKAEAIVVMRRMDELGEK